MILTEQQKEVREAAATYARRSIAPRTREFEAAGCIPVEILAEMGALGFLGMTVAAEHGGAGLDYVSYALALIEIAAGDGGLSTLMSVNNAPVCAILESLGSPMQRERYLRPLATGSMIGAFALTEPQGGSDAAALRTTARRDGDGYVLNGTKQFITSARTAGVTIVFAMTDPAAGKRGISAFLVPRGTAGLTVSRLEDKLGQSSSDTGQLVLADCRVPADHLLGSEGEGYRIALANLEGGRIGIAAQSIGMARAALDAAIDYARERQVFGKVLFEQQAVAFRLADLAARLEAATQLTLHAAALKDAGQRCLKEASMAKLVASETAEAVCSGALQTFGGYGYVRDFIVEKLYRDVRVCQIYEGTSDVQRLVIARELRGAGS
jgi:butyryl-CoA dehydrogenase